MKLDVEIKLGTEKMIASGILANVVLNFKDDTQDAVLIQVYDTLIRLNKETNEPWVAYPQRETNMKDDKTGRNKYISTIKFYPGNTEKFTQFTAHILTQYKKALGGSEKPQTASGRTKSAPASKKTEAKQEPVHSSTGLEGFTF